MELPAYLEAALSQAETQIGRREIRPCRLTITPVLDYLVEAELEAPARLQILYAKILETELEEDQIKKRTLKP